MGGLGAPRWQIAASLVGAQAHTPTPQPTATTGKFLTLNLPWIQLAKPSAV